MPRYVLPTNLVLPTDLDHALGALTELPGEAREGFFGPETVTWQLNRECAVFLGAGRAALLQLAHPWVATALAQHSNLRNDAIGRFHSTFRVVYTMLFGTRAQAVAASRQLYRRHTGIKGALPHSARAQQGEGRYEANEVNALRWVYATLVDSALLAFEFVLPPLTPSVRETYYGESKRIAALCGVAPEHLPKSWSSFTAYMDEMLASSTLAVDANARTLGQSVLSGVATWVRPPLWYRALTTAWLPEHLRAGFGLPFGTAERRSLARAARLLPRLYPLIPTPLRFVGPYREAQARLRHRSPGTLTRASNRFWMGQPRLLYAELADAFPQPQE